VIQPAELLRRYSMETMHAPARITYDNKVSARIYDHSSKEQ
jgi:hypothetical protein